MLRLHVIKGQTEIRGEGLRKEMSADRGGEEGPGWEDGGAMGLSGDARKGRGSLDREIGESGGRSGVEDRWGG